MKSTRVGGLFLDSLHRYGSKCHRRPLITPPVCNAGEPKQQYLLVPGRRSVQVLSMENGRAISELVLDGPEAEVDASVEIHAVCLTHIQKAGTDTEGTILQKSGTESGGDDSSSDGSSSSSDDEDKSEPDEGGDGEWVILGGCSDGTLREWSLESLMSSPRFRERNRGAILIHGLQLAPIYPRRILVIRLGGDNTSVDGPKLSAVDGVTHLSPAGETDTVFALIYLDALSNKLVRIRVPVFVGEGKLQLVPGSDTLTGLATFAIKEKGGSKRKLFGGDEMPTKVFKVFHLPFDLMASYSHEENESGHAFVVVVTKSGLTVYHDKLHASSHSDRFVHYPKRKFHNNLTSACISMNGSDVAVGYAEGHIDIYCNLLDSMRSFLDSNKERRQKNAMENVVVRSVHWHAHSVSSLSFLGNSGGSASNLLSGGEESVLLTWNLDRGLNRPIHTLPRLAKGGVVHITSNAYSSSNMDIVIYCTDNTLRLINGFNYATRWKVQGLADAPVDTAPPLVIASAVGSGLMSKKSKSQQKHSSSNTIMIQDPRTRLPLLTNLPGAPGFVHWYDPASQRVVGTLEVAPYNRVSRRDSTDADVPSPNVTHLALSEAGEDMITIDTILTENSGAGGPRRVRTEGSGSEEKMSLFTTIKFWSWTKVGQSAKRQGQGLDMPFELISAMPSPHGVAGEVVALAITTDGTRACTISHEEDAFRIWGKSRSAIPEGGKSSTPRAPLWKCLYKITTPSGYSNSSLQSGGGQSVAFSSDGSVLAVTYGRHVTLWDHVNASLLTTLSNSEGLNDVRFSKSGADMMLLSGRSSISFQAPFGANNPAYLGGSWSYSLNEDAKRSRSGGAKVEVTFVVPLASRKEIAIALVERTIGKASGVDAKTTKLTKIAVIDEETGEPKMSGGRPILWTIPGNLRAMCDVPRNEDGQGTRLLILTDRHEMLALECADDERAGTGPDASEETRVYDIRSKSESFKGGFSSKGAPKLGVISNKRRKTDSRGTKDKAAVTSQELGAGFNAFDGGTSPSSSAPLPSSDLPVLSSAFTRAFIGRSLRKST